MSVFRFGAVRSPPRRPTIQGSEQSPFCTSPSQLQEVTMDPSLRDSLPFAVGLRSPGKSSPIRGRTMKEYEEQLANLQKENFNLKLRIYFAEQRLTGNCDEDSWKKNIELQTKLEELKKERDVKQELLCQAASAISLMQKEHQEQREMLENRIREMEKELSKSLEQSLSQGLEKSENVSDQTVDTSKDACIEQLKEHILHLEEELSSLKTTRCNCRSSGQVSESTLPCDPVPNEIKSEAKLPAPCNDSESASQSDFESCDLVLLIERLQDVTGKLKELEEKCKVSEEKNSEYEKKCKKVCMGLTNLSNRYKCLVKENEQLKHELERRNSSSGTNNSKDNVHTDVSPFSMGDAETSDAENNLQLQVTEERKSLSLETEQQMQSLLKTLQEKEVLLQEYERKLCATTSELEARDNHIFELKNSINFLQETKTQDGNKSEGQSDEVLSEISTLVNVVESKTRAMLSVEIEEKNEEIKRLNTELRKRTTNLQELVNKELWDKNREIEKLQDRLNNICKVKEVEIVSLLQKLSDREAKLQELQTLLDSYMSKDQAVAGGCELPANVSKCNCSMLQQSLAALNEEKRILSNKVKELEEIVCNTPERDESKMVKDLRALCMQAKKEKELADKRCEDAREGIGILTSRLEELASFMNWLLKNRDALGSLGTRKRDVLKQAIENSMELSRRFSKSFAAYGTGFEDSSFQDIHSLSNILMCSNISDVSLVEWWKGDGGESRDLSSDHKKMSSLSQIPENQQSSVSVKTNVTQSNYGPDKKTPKLVGTSSEGQSFDLISLGSPLKEKGNLETCENSMVNSMTFYNSQQSPRKDSSEKPVEVKDKTPNRTASQNSMLNSILIFDNFRKIHPSKSVPRVSPVKECKSLTEIGTSVPSEVKNIHNKENVGNQAFYAGNSLSNVSDSESWSEPDRNVSLARIGLQEDQVKNISPVSSATGNPNISRNRRIKEFGDTSESSEETAREDTRTPLLKRSKSDSGDMKRLVTRLQQANDAMKFELNILYKWQEALRLSRDKCNVVCLKCHSAAENLANFVLLPVNELDMVRGLRQQLEYSIQKNNCLYLQAISNTANNQASFEVNEGKQQQPLEQFQMKIRELEKKLEEATRQVEESRRIKEQHDVTLKELQMASSKIINLEKQIAELQITIGQEKENESLEKQCLILELENKAKERNIEMEKKLHAEVVLRSKAEAKIKELEEIKENLSSTVNMLQQDVQEIVEKIRDKKPESNEKCVQSAIENANAPKLEIKQFRSQIIELVKERDMLRQNLESVKEMVQLQEEELKRAYNDKYLMKIKEIEEESVRKIKESEEMWKEKDWVQKTEIEKKNMENIKLIEIEQGLRKKIDVLEEERKVVQAESCKSIENLKVKESELLRKVKDLERTLRDMESDFKRQLDNAELVTSEVALEKTKLLNEKLILEKEIRKLESQYAEIVQTKVELENQLQNSRKQFHEQIAACEKQKNELVKHNQQLELAKSTLEEKIVSLQEVDKFGNSHGHRTEVNSPGLRTEVASTGSLPSSLWSDFFDRRTMTTSGSMAIPQHPYSRQCSDMSDYLSEDQQIDESGKMVGRSGRIWSGFGSYPHDTADSLIDLAGTRNMNSSPDLGIESDQGRFSSLEAGMSQSFPLVLLDKGSYTHHENLSALVPKTNFNDELSKLEAENAELKKRLIHTHKALEKTLDQLKSANQRKKQVEKAICSQLHKTNHILKQSRANLEQEAASIKEH